MSISQQDILYARSHEFVRGLSADAYDSGVNPKHRHYTRSQRKKYGWTYQEWHENPNVRCEVMNRFYECDRLWKLMQSQTHAMGQYLQGSGGWVSKAVYESFSTMVESIICEVEGVFLQNGPFLFLIDDEISAQVNEFFWVFTDVYFSAMCTICSMHIRN